MANANGKKNRKRSGLTRWQLRAGSRKRSSKVFPTDMKKAA